MYSIYDNGVKVFHPPFYKPTKVQALRDFETLVNDQKSALHEYPEDFDLYYLGDYDDNTGKITTVASPEHIQKAKLLKKDAEKNA